MTHDREHDATERQADADLGAIERVQVAADYQVELAVPLSSEQLAALERFAREQRISPAEAAQRLVDWALAVRASS